MTYSLMIQAVADAIPTEPGALPPGAATPAGQRARHAPRRRTSHTVAAMSRALTTSSHAPSVS